MKSSKILITSAILLLTLVVTVQASWTPAPANPPENNAPQPLNVTSTSQTKDGLLMLKALITPWLAAGDAIFSGKFQITENSEGKDKVLASKDEFGNAVWKTLSELCTSTGACGGESFWKLLPNNNIGNTNSNKGVEIEGVLLAKQAVLTPSLAAGDSIFSGKFQITNNSEGKDKVLASIDEFGNAKWVATSTILGPNSNYWSIDAGNNISNNNPGDVGVKGNLTVGTIMTSLVGNITGLFMYNPSYSIMASLNPPQTNFQPAAGKILSSIDDNGTAVWADFSNLYQNCIETGSCSTGSDFWQADPADIGGIKTISPRNNIHVSGNSYLAGPITSDGSLKLTSVNSYLELASGLTGKAVKAGQLTYSNGTTKSLNIYGGGNAGDKRLVNIYDDLNVNGTTTANAYCIEGGSCVTTLGNNVPNGDKAGQTLYWDGSAWKNSLAVFITTNAAKTKQSLQVGNIEPNAANDSLYVSGTSNFQGKIKIKTGSLGTFKNGDVLTVIDQTTGESDWKPLPDSDFATGTADQTLRHNGNKWVADSNLINTGTAVATNNMIIGNNLGLKSESPIEFGSDLTTKVSEAGKIFYRSLDGFDDLMINGGQKTSGVNNMIVSINNLLRVPDLWVNNICNGSGQNCNSVANMALPTGSAGTMLYHNGTNWVASTSPIRITNATTTNPNLSINGNVQVGSSVLPRTLQTFKLQVSTTTVGFSPAGKILAGDSSGFANWVDPITLGIGDSNWIRTGTNLSPKNIGDNVGIGTQNPLADLEVSKADNASADIRVSNTNTTGNRATAQVGAYNNGVNNYEGGLRIIATGPVYDRTLGVNDPAFTPNTSILRSGSDVSGGLNISASAGDIRLFHGGNQAVTFKASGNVGIGTDSPTAKLQVNGRAVINGNTTLDNGLTTGEGARLVWMGGAGGNQEFRARVRPDGALTFFPGEGTVESLVLKSDSSVQIPDLDSGTITTNNLEVKSLIVTNSGTLTAPKAGYVLAAHPNGTGLVQWTDPKTLVSAGAVYSALSTGGLTLDTNNAFSISNNGVTTARILDGNVTLAKLAANSVDATKVVDGSIGTLELANGSVTAAKLASMSATSGQVLKWNGSAWSPAADNTGASLPTIASTGDTLRFDGTNWAKTSVLNVADGGSASSNSLVVNGVFWTYGSNFLGGDTTAQTGLRVGFNLGSTVPSPTALLDLNGQLKVRGGSPGVGKVLTSDASGLASWQTLPASGLPAVTSANTNQLLRSNGTTGWVAGGAGLVTNGTEVAVGGTILNGLQKLQVTGGILTDRIKITTGAVSGKVLTSSDNTGTATWASVSSLQKTCAFGKAIGETGVDCNPDGAMAAKSNGDWTYTCPANYPNVVSGGGWCDNAPSGFGDITTNLRESRMVSTPNGPGWKLSCQVQIPNRVIPATQKIDVAGAVLLCSK